VRSHPSEPCPCSLVFLILTTSPSLLVRSTVFYDKILVLDAGRVAEFDTPLNLFAQGEKSIFHQMCVKSSISKEEIERAMAGM
jgi:hypothetical protein